LPTPHGPDSGLRTQTENLTECDTDARPGAAIFSSIHLSLNDFCIDEMDVMEPRQNGCAKQETPDKANEEVLPTQAPREGKV
jgi:hypothetical protein